MCRTFTCQEVFPELLKNLVKTFHRWKMVQEEPILSRGLSEVSLHKFPPFRQAHSGAQDSTGHSLALVQCPSSNRCDSSALPSPLGDSERMC